MVYASGSQFKQHARWCPFKDLFHSEFFVEQSLLIFPFAPENILDWIYHIRVSQGKTRYMHYPAILFPFSVNSFLGCIEMWGWERNTFENKKSLKRNLVFVFYFCILVWWCKFTQRKWFRISSRVSEMQMKDKCLPLTNEVPRWWMSTKLIVIIITPFMHIKSLCLNLHSVVCQYVWIKWNWTKNGVSIVLCDQGCYHGILTTIYHGITASCTGLEFQLSRDDLVIRNLKLWDLEIEAWWQYLWKSEVKLIILKMSLGKLYVLVCSWKWKESHT